MRKCESENLNKRLFSHFLTCSLSRFFAKGGCWESIGVLLKIRRSSMPINSLKLLALNKCKNICQQS